MRLISYTFKDEIWSYSTVNLGRVNLIVGASGSGKTKFLNTIFNLANFIRKNDITRVGKWEMVFAIGRSEYEYEYEAKPIPGTPLADIVHERLAIRGAPADIILRENEKIYFSGIGLPKLSQHSSAIYLLKEEKSVKPVYDAFGMILRRNFFENSLGHATSQTILEKKSLDGLIKQISKNPILSLDWPLSLQLYFLKFEKPELFNRLVDEFCSTFPSVKTLTVQSKLNKSSHPLAASGYSLVVEAKEHGIKSAIPLQELSSGMQKVLLIMTDAILLPKGSIYLIDEYENSLGVNAINFLPTFINEFSKDTQFLITTHHEYLINKIPVKNWQIFSRNGAHVTIRDGATLSKKFATSKQDSFMQLINDPLYASGPK